MRSFILFLLLPSFAAMAQKKPSIVKLKGFVITGNLSSLKKGAEVKLINANTNAEIVSSTVQEKIATIKKNGRLQKTTSTSFVLKAVLPEPTLCSITIEGKKPFVLYAENSDITIKGNANDTKSWVVSGSNAHKDFKDFENKFTPLANDFNASAGAINKALNNDEKNKLMELRRLKQIEINNTIDSFINNRTQSFVSAFVLLVMHGFNPDPFLAESRLSRLSPAVQQSYLGNILQGQIEDGKIGAIGSKALEFTQPDTSGNPVALSSFKGKYVLVDFWASWCGPCRMENPNVVSNYNKFKDKNFTILGVSLEKPGQKAEWINAIKADKLTWAHVSDLQFWNNEVAKLYHIQGIPQNILVDPNGTIIAKNLRGPDLEAKLCELLGCN